MKRNFTHHWCRVPKARGGTLQSVECHPGISDHMGKIRKFWPGEGIFLWHFAPMVPKVSHQYFSPVLATLRLKIPIWYFWQGCDHFPISVLLTNAATNGGIRDLNKILLPWPVTMHCSHPPFPFSTWFIIIFFFFLICMQKIIITESTKSKSSSYFHPSHFNNKLAWLQKRIYLHQHTCLILALVCTSSPCSHSSWIGSSWENVESRTHTVSFHVTLAWESRRTHLARGYSQHYQ